MPTGRCRLDAGDAAPGALAAGRRADPRRARRAGRQPLLRRSAPPCWPRSRPASRRSGSTPVAALEFEFYLLDAPASTTAAAPVPHSAPPGPAARRDRGLRARADRGPGAASSSLVRSTAKPRTCRSRAPSREFAPGQFEINLGHGRRHGPRRPTRRPAQALRSRPRRAPAASAPPSWPSRSPIRAAAACTST